MCFLAVWVSAAVQDACRRPETQGRYRRSIHRRQQTRDTDDAESDFLRPKLNILHSLEVRVLGPEDRIVEAGRG